MKLYNTLKSQIELLPRITIIYDKGIALGIEWLWFCLYIKVLKMKKIKKDWDKLTEEEKQRLIKLADSLFVSPQFVPYMYENDQLYLPKK